MNTYFFKLTFLILSLVSITTACTEENLDKCIPGVTVNYYYTYNKQNKNLFGKEVHELSILVFDENEKFSRIFHITDSAALHNNNSIYLPLPAGNWTILTWGGYIDNYHLGESNSKNKDELSDLIAGVSNLSDFRLTLDTKPSDNGADIETQNFISNLYYGTITPVTTCNNRIVSKSVPMMKNTNDITIRIKGIHGIETLRADEFKSYIQMSNHRYDSENRNQSGDKKLIYLRDCLIENGIAKSNLRVLKLEADDTSSYLCVESKHLPNGGIKVPLIKTILESPQYNDQSDLDKEDDYVFEFVVNYDLSVDITINDWVIKDVIPEM